MVSDQRGQFRYATPGVCTHAAVSLTVAEPTIRLPLQIENNSTEEYFSKFKFKEKLILFKNVQKVKSNPFPSCFLGISIG